MLRTQRARLLIAALGGAIAVAAPVPAGAEDTEPAVVVNGTFSSPTVPAGQSFEAGIDGWTGGGRASAARAAHPRGFQAAGLGWNGSISTQLRGVRAGATVTLSWDDNPDSCTAQGAARRPYRLVVAGAPGQPVDFATNDGTGKANWFLGRTYSFTAPADAPQITFAVAAAQNISNCPVQIANVAAKQTATQLAPSDPCAGDAASTPQCKDVAAGKDQISKCPPTDRDCLAGVAGKGDKENAAIGKETQAVEDFGKVPRDQDPNTAASDLCTLPNALTSSVQPGDAVVPPSDWWFC
ncbi:hypothetical protein ACFV4M_31460 [Kitasatospora indigofera]|uniref:hypothetical protein n=1 Tax=Kitasatospora indigofera TaxID=67307 RepID=UPI00364D8E55